MIGIDYLLATLATVVTILTGLVGVLQWISIRKKSKQKKQAEDNKSNLELNTSIDQSLRKIWLSQSNESRSIPNLSTVPKLKNGDMDTNYLESTSITVWQTNLRRKLICPFWATNLQTGELGYVKRVMPPSEFDDQECIILQVTMKEINVKWDARDTYPTDRLSHNALLLQHFRTSIIVTKENCNG